MCAVRLLIFLALSFAIAFGEEIDYCNRSLCKKTGNHIACGNNGSISLTCADYSRVIELTPAIQAIIVKKHNQHRSTLALGFVTHFPPATRMATMEWNDELAKLADLNVKTCTGTHDICRNTFKFPHSGQNIARRSTKGFDSISLEQLEYNIKRGIDRWFQEYSICPRDGTTVYTTAKKKCGHFTIMAIERNVYFGCAILHMQKRKTVFTCNYAWTNMRNQKLYEPGVTASHCKTGRNREYPGLCSASEKYE